MELSAAQIGYIAPYHMKLFEVWGKHTNKSSPAENTATWEAKNWLSGCKFSQQFVNTIFLLMWLLMHDAIILLCLITPHKANCLLMFNILPGKTAQSLIPSSSFPFNHYGCLWPTKAPGYTLGEGHQAPEVNRQGPLNYMSRPSCTLALVHIH